MGVVCMEEFEKIWGIYIQSFPPVERRSREAQENLMKEQKYHMIPFYMDDILVGFIAYWDLEEIIFIEHLAVDKVHQGKGYGKKIVGELIISHDRRIILEVDPPEDEISKKRIKFYENLGFHLNRFNYYQPSLGEGKGAVSLLLMTYPEVIQDHQLLVYAERIHRIVYKSQFK